MFGNTIIASSNNHYSVNTDNFSSILAEIYLEPVNVNENVLIYICGYSSFKAAQGLSCGLCTDFVFGSYVNDEYFNNLNRGRLTIPSDASL